ncbi:helix-turn-helix transcriptional regulator [Hominifimenecus sp. rT4P-3]|uniref:helix-turn-helix transcriptional regulator n=1 Tax=Hominifimenecus sp. rT4P-3 TaxID=3242979 RepID=UPI003DA4F26E
MGKKQKNMIPATRLRELREKAELSQSDLARLSNYTPQTISYYETGNRRITYEAARIFSTIFKVRIEYIMGEDDFPDEESLDKQFFTDAFLKDFAFETLLKMLSVSISDGYINMQEFPSFKKSKEPVELSDMKESVEQLQRLWLYENKCITVTEKEFYDLRDDVLDYLQYRLDRIFQNHDETSIPNNISFTSYECGKAAAEMVLSGEVWEQITIEGRREF